METIDRGPDATLNGTYQEWFRMYLDEQPPRASLEEADEGRVPFVKDGRIHIFSQTFQSWLQTRREERITRGTLTTQLRTFGAEPGTHYLTVDGKQTSRSAWRLPDQFKPDDYS
jgi:hypothetical protein